MRSLHQQNDSSKADGRSALKYMRPVCGVQEYDQWNDLGHDLSSYGVYNHCENFKENAPC